MTTKKSKIIGIASSPVLDFMGPPRPIIERMYLFNDGRIVTEIRGTYGPRSMAVMTGADVLKRLKAFTEADEEVEKSRKKERGFDASRKELKKQGGGKNARR